MTRGTLAGVVLVTAVAVAGCSGDGSKGGTSRDVYDSLAKLPVCSSWDGKVVSAKTWGDGCLLRPTEVAASGSTDCTDGRQLWYNDWGWGYGGEVAHHHARADGQLVPPDAVDEACRRR